MPVFRIVTTAKDENSGLGMRLATLPPVYLEATSALTASKAMWQVLDPDGKTLCIAVHPAEAVEYKKGQKVLRADKTLKRRLLSHWNSSSAGGVAATPSRTVYVRVAEPVHKQLKSRARAERCSLNEAAIEAIFRYLGDPPLVELLSTDV